MLDQVGIWLSDNKDWFLSGLGVSILAVLGWFWRQIWTFFKAWRKKSPPEVKAPSIQKSAVLQDAMQTTQILFIDDDIKFRVVSILQTAGWQYTRIVKDIASLNDDAVRRAHILFVDINGVGKKMSFKDEGLGLALALKTRYPEKRVIIYSADTKAERFHEAWKRADDYLAKNADPYEFQQLVEGYAVNRGSK